MCCTYGWPEAIIFRAQEVCPSQRIIGMKMVFEAKNVDESP